MAEGTYVQLTKEQEAVVENITPGELNQPIDIDRFTCRRCPECGQPLPKSHQPPADEDWTTGIFGCTEDLESCLTGLFCPCVLFGRNVESLNEEISQTGACVGHVICVEGGITLAVVTAAMHGIDPDTMCLITEGLLFTWWVCGIYTGMARQALQRKYHLKDAPCDPCLVHCCFHWCAVCQEYREMRNHLEENTASVTIVEPPPIQEMNVILPRKDAESIQEMNVIHARKEAESIQEMHVIHARKEAESSSSGKEIVPVIQAVEMKPSSS
ncbi:PREDICTED: cell number regulator 6-like [Ipomoea nil]|uniref:cell number regulator 6-like n=1 Tax=Ipomoea nil TaxID=35883 RepID=UPI0009016020|nr:PREDICTED: cell number regulator 6-like [Ipomoea nil]